MRFLVIGAGAIGAYVAAHLAREHEVLLGVRSRARRENLGVVEARGETTATLRRVIDSDPPEAVDGVIVATKNGSLEKVALNWAAWLEGPVIGIQNGLQDMFPSCIVTFPATRLDDGVSERTGPGGFYLDNDAPACFDALSLAAPVTRTFNMDGVRWTKLIVNSCISGLGAIAGVPLHILLQDPRARRAFAAISREGYEVGQAEGIEFVPIHGFHPRLFSKGPAVVHYILLRILGRKHKMHRSSSLQSLDRGEATEIAYLNGEIARLGRRHNIATPVNDAVVGLDGATPSLRNLDKL